MMTVVFVWYFEYKNLGMTLVFLHDIKKSNSSTAFLYLQSNFLKFSCTTSWPYIFYNVPPNELSAGKFILSKSGSATVAMRKAVDPNDILVVEYLMNTDLTLIDWNNILFYMTWNGLLHSIRCNSANSLQVKVSLYPFKQPKKMLKNMKMLLYTYFYNISLNLLRLTLFNIYKLPFSGTASIAKIRVWAISYFSWFMSSCTNRIGAFNNLFALICSQARDKQSLVHDILLLKYLFNNLLLNVSKQNTFSKFVELLLENLITKFLNAL